MMHSEEEKLKISCTRRKELPYVRLLSWNLTSLPSRHIYYNKIELPLTYNVCALHFLLKILHQGCEWKCCTIYELNSFEKNRLWKWGTKTQYLLYFLHVNDASLWKRELLLCHEQKIEFILSSFFFSTLMMTKWSIAWINRKNLFH